MGNKGSDSVSCTCMHRKHVTLQRSTPIKLSCVLSDQTVKPSCPQHPNPRQGNQEQVYSRA